MELTNLEIEIIKAYRDGAEVNLYWHSVSDKGNAVQHVTPFGEPRWDASDGTMWVKADDFPRVKAVVFVR